MASLSQIGIFSLVLHTSYEASLRSKMNQSFITEGSTEDSSFYSFKTPKCPFGFVLLAKPIKTHTVTIRNEALTMSNPLETNVVHEVSSVPTALKETDVYENSHNSTISYTENGTTSMIETVLKTTESSSNFTNYTTLASVIKNENHTEKPVFKSSRSRSKKKIRITCLAPSKFSIEKQV